MLVEEYDTSKTLFNFLMPTTLKKSFDLVCRYKTSSKSQTLNDLIKSYVLENGEVIEKEVNKQNKMLNLFK